jgi:hypothetical protein
MAIVILKKLTVSMMGWLEAPDSTLSDGVSTHFMEYHSTTELTLFVIFFKVLAGLRHCT